MRFLTKILILLLYVQKKAASDDSDGEMLDDTDDEDFSGYVPKVCCLKPPFHGCLISKLSP
jgi:hypothetical protein